MNLKSKKQLFFMVIGALTLIIVVLSATYAYFVAQSSGSSNTNVNVGTNTTDNLSFETKPAVPQQVPHLQPIMRRIVPPEIIICI